MVTFSYKIKDDIGIHARPAGMLAKLAKEFKSEILIKREGKTVNAAKLMMLMGLGVKCGDVITVTVSGEDELEAAKAIEEFLNSKL